jgi:hypothetical protein
MSFRRRTYPEVLDGLLTGIVGGQSGESHAFPPADSGPPYIYALEKAPVAQLVSVWGSRNGQPHLFVGDTDYAQAGDGQTLIWQEGGEWPDPGSLFQVNYLPDTAGTGLDDLYVGSVLRTLAEVMGLEIARLYAQLDAVYRSAFLDTAEASALDKVVALLGMRRVRAGRFSGELVFSRTPGSHGEIHIPAGTRVLTADGNLEYETVAAVTVLDGQNTARVGARDVEANSEGVVAEQLTIIAKPIVGIQGVTNPAPTAAAGADESDEQLRVRTRGFLHASERATVGALKEALSHQGVPVDVVELEQNGFRNGRVQLIPHAEAMTPELSQRLNTVKDQVRPLGVDVRFTTGVVPKKVDLSLRLVTSPALLEQDLRAAQDAVRAKVANYLEGLAVAETGSTNRLVGLILSVAEVEDVEVLALAVQGEATPVGTVTLEALGLEGSIKVPGGLQLIDPNLPTRLQVLVRHPDGEIPPDPALITSATDAMTTYLAEVNGGAVPAVTGLGYQDLLFVVPLPVAGKATGALADLFSLLSPPTPPQGADVAPYGLRFVFTQQSGLSEVLEQDGDSYTLSAFERLSLAGVEIDVEIDGEAGDD